MGRAEGEPRSAQRPPQAGLKMSVAFAAPRQRGKGEITPAAIQKVGCGPGPGGGGRKAGQPLSFSWASALHGRGRIRLETDNHDLSSTWAPLSEAPTSKCFAAGLAGPCSAPLARQAVLVELRMEPIVG